MAAGGDRAVSLSCAGEGHAHHISASHARAPDRAEGVGDAHLHAVVQGPADEDVAGPERAGREGAPYAGVDDSAPASQDVASKGVREAELVERRHLRCPAGRELLVHTLPGERPEIVMSNHDDGPPRQVNGCGEVTRVGSRLNAAHAADGSVTSPPVGPQSRWKTAWPTLGLIAVSVSSVPARFVPLTAAGSHDEHEYREREALHVEECTAPQRRTSRGGDVAEPVAEVVQPVVPVVGECRDALHRAARELDELVGRDAVLSAHSRSSGERSSGGSPAVAATSSAARTARSAVSSSGSVACGGERLLERFQSIRGLIPPGRRNEAPTLGEHPLEARRCLGRSHSTTSSRSIVKPASRTSRELISGGKPAKNVCCAEPLARPARVVGLAERREQPAAGHEPARGCSRAAARGARAARG